MNATVEPLDIRRDRFAALTLERFKRMEDDNPCKEMTTKWKEKTRIQKTSFLKKTSDISKEFQFPKNRDVSKPIPEALRYSGHYQRYQKSYHKRQTSQHHQIF